MIYITLKEQTPETNNIHYADGYEPDYFGYNYNMSDDDIWNYNRGVYRLGKAATKENYVAFVYRNKVVSVAKIDSVERYDDQHSYFNGSPLSQNNAVYKKWVGSSVPTTRNPIRYESDPDFDSWSWKNDDTTEEILNRIQSKLPDHKIFTTALKSLL